MPRRFFRRRRSLSLALLACLLTSFAAPASAQDDTMMQAFYWDVPTDSAANNGSWWLNLRGKSAELRRAGVTGVWTPPPSKGNFGIFDMGYGVFDHFDLGNYPVKGTTETRFGSRAELEAMIAAMHAEGVEVYSDVVLNHIFTDYRELEVNPAVESYIRNEATTATGTHTAYPVNETVWRIPDAQPGDYFIQIKGYNLNCAASQDERGYEVYATWTNPDPNFPYTPNVPQTPPYNFESEPNNGAGNTDDFPGTGQRIWGHINACGDIDQYKITLTEAHDINLLIDAKRGAPGTALTGADPRNGYRIAHAYGPGGVDFAATTMQVLT
ncbi:MAG: alpha-amylase, partial [Acidobacteria bacterium]|nr:alpha-amylase [Acidobacteriota bacterium]